MIIHFPGKRTIPERSDCALTLEGRGVPVAVYDLLKNTLPLHPGKIREISEAHRVFLEGLRNISYVELHCTSESVDNEAFLFYAIKVGEKELHHSMLLGDFLELLTAGNWDNLRDSSDALIACLREIFGRISLELGVEYFSPSDFGMNFVNEKWTDAVLHFQAYVPGEYFYIVQVKEEDDDGSEKVNPNAIIDSHPEATVLTLIAKYIEQNSENEQIPTTVGVLRYSYIHKKTRVMTIGYNQLRRLCLTHIDAIHPLLHLIKNPEDKISAYLDRVLAKTIEDSEILSLGVKK